MASEQDRRTADYEEVKAALAQHPAIRLVQVEGEPPDCYQLEYRLTGLARDTDGTVRKASQHMVLLSLPFGYPHFPPAVKPLTPIFHPDIDPDAVRIAALWQQQPSLAGLIIHLGEMISGRIYSLDDPFNQEAADWYSEHAAELPFDSPAPAAAADDGLDLGLELDLEMLGKEDGQNGEGLDLALELEPPQAAAPVFDLGLEPEAEAASEEDGLDLGLDIEEEPQAVVQQDLGPKLEELRAHVGRKEMTIAARLLAELPASGGPELEAVRRTVRAALEERDQLLQKLKVLEDEDNFTAAEEVLKKIKKIAVDTPGLAEIGRRLQQSKAMLDTFAVKSSAENEEAPPAENEETPPVEEQKKKPKKTKEPPPSPKEPAAIKERPAGRAKVARRTAGMSLPSTPALIAVGLAVAILGGGMLYTRDADNLREARRIWRDIDYLARQKKFQEAELKAKDAIDVIDSILIPFLGQHGLEDEIVALRESEEFKMGLEGKGKYKGQILPLPEIEKRNELDRLTALAETLAKNGKIKEAVPAYEEAWKFAAKNGFTAEAQLLEELKQQLSMKDALENLGRELEQYMQEALKAFQRELEQSQKGFTDAQWQKVAEMLEHALQLLDKNPTPVPPEKRQEIKKLLVRARLYQMLASARQAYDRGDAASSVAAYRQALQLIKDNQPLVGETYSDSAAKISQTMVNIEIRSEQKAAAAAEQKKEFSAALEHYSKLLALLVSSGAAQQEVNVIKAKIETLNAESGLAMRKKWLEQNFERIFRAAYPPASSASVLSNPGLTLVKKLNELEVYTLRCSEQSQGSSYQLELKYLYNPVTNQWSPYSGQ